MKLWIYSFLAFLMSFLVCGQSKEKLNLKINKNSNWEIQIDTINKEDFNFDYVKKTRWYEEVNSDSLIKSNIKKFNKSFTKTDSCIILNSIEKPIKLCYKQSLKNEKINTSYKIVGSKNGYLLFTLEGWEGWSFILFNPKNRKAIITEGLPIFIDNDFIFTCDNYYAEGFFELIDKNKKKYYRFDSYNWELSKFYRLAKKIFIEFTSNSDFKSKKYIVVTHK